MESEFYVQIDFEKGTETPERVFQSMSGKRKKGHKRKKHNKRKKGQVSTSDKEMK